MTKPEPESIRSGESGSTGRLSTARGQRNLIGTEPESNSNLLRCPDVAKAEKLATVVQRLAAWFLRHSRRSHAHWLRWA